MANRKNGTLYTGVTAHLAQRVHQHKNGLGSCFTKKYHCHLLVYYAFFELMTEAIDEEKRLKKGPRARKIERIEKINPEWKDLYESIL